MLKFLKSILYFVSCVGSLSLWAITTVSVTQETSAFILDIKYPQEFKNPIVNALIENYIEGIKKKFIEEANNDTNTKDNLPGKTSLTVTYSLPYDKKTALSVFFTSSIYHKGAAHPTNKVTVLNFIKGQQVFLPDLFRVEADYLKLIAEWSKKKLSEKNISNSKWIAEGTKPTEKNYETWSFSTGGINIIFNTYQVAPYVHGPQKVEIPYTKMLSLLKPEIVHEIWGQ